MQFVARATNHATQEKSSIEQCEGLTFSAMVGFVLAD
jgi:hypothetical protein